MILASRTVRLNAKLVYPDEIRETFKRLRDEYGIDAGKCVTAEEAS